MTTEHPFAQYVRILGKGRHGSRALTEDEARLALGMILDDAAEPVQTGAFLMLMRVKEETPEEVAGFVRAVRERIPLPMPAPVVDLDWSSYAGKRRHLPWFILSTLLLAANGVRVFMHGAGGHTVGRLYTRDILQQLGLTPSLDLNSAATQLAQNNFAYVDLADLCPALQAIMDLRPLFGLRSPVHTVARMLNPLNAPYQIQGIFHPGYQDIHQGAALCLKQPHAAIIKGEGGEIERNPDSPCKLYWVNNGETGIEDWPSIFERRHVRPDQLNVTELAALWRGTHDDEYATGAVTGTCAIALRLLGKADSPSSAMALAQEWWNTRPRDWL